MSPEEYHAPTPTNHYLLRNRHLENEWPTVDAYALRTVIGNGQKTPIAAKDLDSIPALEANLEAAGIAADPTGRISFTDRNMVRRDDPVSGLVARIAGQFAPITPSGTNRPCI